MEAIYKVRLMGFVHFLPEWLSGNGGIYFLHGPLGPTSSSRYHLPTNIDLLTSVDIIYIIFVLIYYAYHNHEAVDFNFEI